MQTDTQIDPYILGLAAASAPCFGYHDAAVASCGGCPVASRCVQARYSRAVLVAAQLLKKAERKLVKDEPKVVKATVTVNNPATESIDDILASMAKGMSTPAYPQPVAAAIPIKDTTIDDLFPDLNVAPAPVAAPVAASVADGPKLTKMKAVIDSVCYSCSGKIGRGTDAVFLPGKGLRHTDCP